MNERKVAVVTGSNRGIGLEIARQLIALDLHVIVTARDGKAAEAALADLKGERGAASAHALDISDGASVTALAAHVEAVHGRIDVLVNNAGIAPDAWRSLFDLDIDTFRTTMETNVYGTLRCCQAFVPMMKKRNYGRVVNLSSQLGSLTRMTGNSLAYRTSKTAVNALTRVLADELKDTNILVNAASPGWVRTDMGGKDAPRSPEEGARGSVRLATLPDDGPRGGFFDDHEELPW